LCYPSLFPYGTDGWTSEQRLHTINVLERQDGQVVDFERLEVQNRRAKHRITPKDFLQLPTHALPCLAIESPEAIIFFIPPFISRLFGGLLQEERGMQFNFFEDEPPKSQLWNVARPTLH
jgi:hypothetical protein